MNVTGEFLFVLLVGGVATIAGIAIGVYLCVAFSPQVETYQGQEEAPDEGVWYYYSNQTIKNKQGRDMFALNGYIQVVTWTDIMALRVPGYGDITLSNLVFPNQGENE